MKNTLWLAALSLTASAQWLHHPTPGIPRTPDGKPNLTAPAPRTADGKPDLSGIWTMAPGKYAMNIAADLKKGDVAPAVEALYEKRREDLGRESPFTSCLPQGPAINLNPVAMNRIVQTPGLMVILSEDLTYRQVFLDGRELPQDPNPSFMGYSVGRWEGDTLVVESSGFNDRTWLDFGGHAHSEELRVTERLRRPDFGHMQIVETFSDPKMYTRPWSVTIDAGLITDTEILEYVCAENEQDVKHLVGKASDSKKNSVKLAPEILARYVGTYDFRFPENPTQTVPVVVTLSGGELSMEFLGGKQPMYAMSETRFTFDGNPITFVMDDRGRVSHFIVQAAEGDLRVNRIEKP